MSLPEPSPANGFLAEHVRLLTASYRRWTGKDLIDPTLDPIAAARFLYHAPFALVSHDTRQDPVFNYANLTAQRLFGMDWPSFTRLPSRLSAEPLAQAERSRLLAEVSAKGYLADYRGVRIARDGRRFRLEGAEIWNVCDTNGAFYGQAARIARWRFL
ncbi:MEKHLA domain-containing protein [Methylothermus subterraneus]